MPNSFFRHVTIRKVRFSRLFIALAAVVAPLGLAACGGSNEIAQRYEPVDLKRAPDMRVNGYLWQASLDTLGFMPLDSTDATGGVIVTDWYSHPSAPGERSKVRVAILDSKLRSDALSVNVNRQVRDSSGNWTDAAVQQSTVAGIEDAILTRARQIRIGTVVDPDSRRAYEKQEERRQRRASDNSGASRSSGGSSSSSGREGEPSGGGFF